MKSSINRKFTKEEIFGLLESFYDDNTLKIVKESIDFLIKQKENEAFEAARLAIDEEDKECRLSLDYIPECFEFTYENFEDYDKRKT